MTKRELKRIKKKLENRNDSKKSIVESPFFGDSAHAAFSNGRDLGFDGLFESCKKDDPNICQVTCFCGDSSMFIYNDISGENKYE